MARKPAARSARSSKSKPASARRAKSGAAKQAKQKPAARPSAAKAVRGVAKATRSAAKPARAAASVPARKPAASVAKQPSPLAALAQKLVEATLDESKFSIPALYSADTVSVEGNGNIVRGHDGLAQKLAMWNQMQEGTKWRARNVALGKNLIVIEWDADVTLRGGRVTSLCEVAVHEIEDGKIVSERYYYDPSALAPIAS